MSKIKCALCRFRPVDEEGNRPAIRNAEFIWEGVGICEEHLLERRAQLIQMERERQNPSGLLVPTGPADPLT